MMTKTKRNKTGAHLFAPGNRAGVLLHPPLKEGEKTKLVAGKIPESLEEQFNALPKLAGLTQSQRVRLAVEILTALTTGKLPEQDTQARKFLQSEQVRQTLALLQSNFEKAPGT
jgi:hypothetical protein